VIFNSSWNWDKESESILKSEQEKLVDTGEEPVEGEISQENKGQFQKLTATRLRGVNKLLPDIS